MSYIEKDPEFLKHRESIISDISSKTEMVLASDAFFPFPDSIDVAAEMGVVGYLRGPSAWTQKTPPLQLKTDEAKSECDALANRELTDLTEAQHIDNDPIAKELPYTFQAGKTDYA